MHGNSQVLSPPEVPRASGDSEEASQDEDDEGEEEEEEVCCLAMIAPSRKNTLRSELGYNL